MAYSTKLLNHILNFVFIIPAWILFILCFPDFPVFSRLLPENRMDKNCVEKKTQVWKQTSARGINEFKVNCDTRVLLDRYKTKFTKTTHAREESQTLIEVTHYELKRLVRLIPELSCS